MIGRATSFLGLAFSDSRIACAEVTAGGDRRVVRRIATFAFTPEHPLEKPDATGVALAAFLREKRFTASRAVAGVPARWLIASEKDVPPANEQQAVAALTLQAERAAGGEGNEIVFDFSGEPSPQAASRVLLVGIAKQQLDRVTQILDAAGLTIVAITSTGLALAGNIKDSESDAAMLLLGAAGGEMILRSGGLTRGLRHVSMTSNGNGMPAIAPLGAELRRALAMNLTSGSGPTRQMLLLDGVGLDAEHLADLSNRSGMTMKSGDGLKLLGVTADPAATARISGEPAPDSLASFAPAVSLALTAGKPELLPLDFSHSRLAPKTGRHLGRNGLLGIVAGILAIVLVVYLYSQMNRSQTALDKINTQLKSIERESTDAQKTVDRVAYARGYYDLRPSALECLRQITLMFHDDEKIWVTNFNLKDNGKGSLLGKAADQATALQIIDRVKKNAKFTLIEHTDVHEADARTHEWQFSFNFTYNFAE